MSRTNRALALGALVAGSALASPYAMAECNGFDMTGSFALTNEYVFRGIDSSGSGAAQGSLDVMHCPTGLYSGVWGSNTFAGTTEVDVYGGWRYAVGDWGLDMGVIGYLFPENNEKGFTNTDYVEGYIGGSWKWFSLTGYYADDYFNTSEEGWYIAGGFSWPFKPDLSLNIHVGYSEGDGVDEFIGDSYLDYEVMLVKNVQDIVDVGIGAVGTDLDGSETGLIASGHDDAPKFLVRVSKEFDI